MTAPRQHGDRIVREEGQRRDRTGTARGQHRDRGTAALGCGGSRGTEPAPGGSTGQLGRGMQPQRLPAPTTRDPPFLAGGIPISSCTSSPRWPHGTGGSTRDVSSPGGQEPSLRNAQLLLPREPWHKRVLWALDPSCSLRGPWGRTGVSGTLQGAWGGFRGAEMSGAVCWSSLAGPSRAGGAQLSLEKVQNQGEKWILLQLK